nr:thioredoxin [Candidatus Gracilibacteria bacterium]
MGAIVLTEQNFDETIATGVTLVDFWAEWCGPCQMMLPILADFAKKMEGKMKVAKVNVDENPGLAAKFRVMSIPNLVVFKDGKPVEQMVGVQQIDSLEKTCGKYL